MKACVTLYLWFSVVAHNYISVLFHGFLIKVQELCESRGSRLGFPVLMSLTVSVDVKQH